MFFDFVIILRRCLSFMFRLSICSAQIVGTTSIQCRSNQWLWHRPRCRSGDMSIMET